MKVEDFAEITKSKAGKSRVLKYFIFDIEILHSYFKDCNYKPARLAKSLDIHYQSVRKLLQSADLWKHVSIINGKGSGDNLKRRAIKAQNGYKFSDRLDDNRLSMECGKRRSRRKFEHIAVMERHLGRELSKGEVIHHIDGDKLNNNLENLFLCSRSEHSKIHKQLEYLAANLVRDGLIVFQNGTYKLAVK